MDFGKAIKALNKGKAIARGTWPDSFVVRQVPANIGEDVIPKMQSLPQVAKFILMRRVNKVIKYTNQMLIIERDGTANSWLPSAEDIFAKDWVSIEVEASDEEEDGLDAYILRYTE